jgi:hypothetical protein
MGPEGRLQKTVTDWARREFKEDELICRKFQAGMYGSNGWPDYDWLKKGGEIFFIEFKAPGGKCSPLQLRRHAQLRALGFRVYVCDSADQARQIIRQEMRRAA